MSDNIKNIDDYRYTYLCYGGRLIMDSYKYFVKILKVISEETRLKIIDMISCGEMCACDILDKLSISQSTLSYHMNLLTNSGLVDVRKDGTWMKYKLNEKKFDELKSFIENISSKKPNCICK